MPLPILLTAENRKGTAYADERFAHGAGSADAKGRSGIVRMAGCHPEVARDAAELR